MLKMNKTVQIITGRLEYVQCADGVQRFHDISVSTSLACSYPRTSCSADHTSPNALFTFAVIVVALLRVLFGPANAMNAPKKLASRPLECAHRQPRALKPLIHLSWPSPQYDTNAPHWNSALRCRTLRRTTTSEACSYSYSKTVCGAV